MTVGQSQRPAGDALATGGGGAGMGGIARGGLLNLVGAAVSSVTGILLTVVVTRTLPKADAGAFFTLISVFVLVEMLACLGTDAGLVYFIARTRSLGRADRVRDFQRVALRPVVVVSVAAAVALAACSPLVARLIGSDGTDARLAVVFLAVLLPVATVSDTLLAATRGYGAMRPTVLVERIGRTLLQVGLVALAVLGGSLTAVSAAWALPWLGSAVLAALWLRHLGRSLPRSGAPRRDEHTAREFWRFTWARGVHSIAQLVLQRFDILLITALLGPAQAAVYTAATRFLVIGQLTGASIGNAAQPRLAALFAVDDRRAAQAVYQSATGWSVLLTWPLYLLCAVFADVVLLVFGHGYSAGRPVIVVLAGAMLVATGCGMVDTLLIMAGRTTWTLTNSLVAVAVMVGVDLLLIPHLGILGAGIGWAAAIVTNNLVPLTQLLVAFRLHPFGRATLASAALAVACFGVIPGVARLLEPGSAMAAVIAVAVGAALFVVGCVRWRTALDLPGLAVLRPQRR